MEKGGERIEKMGSLLVWRVPYGSETCNFYECLQRSVALLYLFFLYEYTVSTSTVHL